MSETVDTPTVSFVDDPERVRAALQLLEGDVVGVDVERADADNYHRRAALVQVGVPGHCILLDGVTLTTMGELDAFLGPDRLAILHAIENDLAPLANKGVVADAVADTAIAAALLGLPTGLGPLLEQLLGVALPGDKSAFQRADWGARPLSEGMASYAAGDVVHLPALWTELAARLDDLGRREWYDQELTHTVERALVDQRSWTKVKGIGRMSGQERAAVRAVWETREELARTHDIAPNRLLHDDVIREIVTDPPRTAPQLIRRSRRRRAPLREHAPALLEALERGLDAEPEAKDRTRRWTDVDRATHDAMRLRRSEVAEELGLDPGVLCPSKVLWNAVAGDPDDAARLCALAELRPWQADVLGEPLWDAYLEARTAGPEAGVEHDPDDPGDDTTGPADDPVDTPR